MKEKTRSHVESNTGGGGGGGGGADIMTPTFKVASVPGFSFMQYGCGAENTKKSLVDFDHVGTVTCNGMQS